MLQLCDHHSGTALLLTVCRTESADSSKSWTTSAIYTTISYTVQFSTIELYMLHVTFIVTFLHVYLLFNIQLQLQIL